MVIILCAGCAKSPEPTSAGSDPVSTATASDAETAAAAAPATATASATSSASTSGSLEVQVFGGGAHTGKEPFAVSAKQSGQGIRVRLDGFLYFCGMGPKFMARLEGTEVIIATDSLKAGVPVPQCVEGAPYSLQIGPLQPGSYTVRVDGKPHSPVSVSVGTDPRDRRP